LKAAGDVVDYCEAAISVGLLQGGDMRQTKAATVTTVKRRQAATTGCGDNYCEAATTCRGDDY